MSSTNVFGKSVDQNVSSDALTINLNEQVNYCCFRKSKCLEI